ncbi:MAG: hypothetical protein ABIG71_04825 [Candidatus Uhrbacteria bacterium]
MNLKNILPEVLALQVHDPADAHAARQAYIKWTKSTVEARGFSWQLLVQQIEFTSALGRAPDEYRHLFIAKTIDRLGAFRSNYIKNVPLDSNCSGYTMPVVPAILDLLGDIDFLRAEGTAGMLTDAEDLEEQQRSIHLTRFLFRESVDFFDAAATMLEQNLANIEEVTPDGFDGTVFKRGLKIAWGQAISNHIRAIARECSYSVIAAHPNPSRNLRMCAPTKDVLEIQSTMSERGLDEDEHRVIACACERAAHSLAGPALDLASATTMVMNISTLAAIAGCWTRVWGYTSYVIATLEHAGPEFEPIRSRASHLSALSEHYLANS